MLKLMDEYKANYTGGKDTTEAIEAFKAENADWTTRTKTIKIHKDNTLFFFIKDYIPEEGKVLVAMLDEDSLTNLENGDKIGTLKKWNYQRCGVPEELIEEAYRTTGLMLSINNEMFLISEQAIKTLARQSELGGTEILKRRGLIKAMDLAQAFYAENTVGVPSVAVYREENIDGAVIKKIFAVMSGHYVACPATTLNVVADKFLKDKDMTGGTGEGAMVDSYNIDHTLTQIRLSFEKAGEDFVDEYGVKVTPGLLLQTSDVGESSMTAYGVIRGENGYVLTDDVSMRHSKKLDMSSFVENVDKHIFGSIRRIPEKLASLMGVSLWDDGKSDEQNAEYAKSILEEVYKVVSARSKASKEKCLDPLLDAMKGEIVTGAHYTGYDIAMMFMDAPDRAHGISDSCLLLLRRGFADAPFEVEKALKKHPVYLV